MHIPSSLIFQYSSKEHVLSDLNDTTKAVFRVLDVNLNRLREALRVIEEYFRFIALDGPIAAQLKRFRHFARGNRTGRGAVYLLESRDTHSDPFANVNRAEEMGRQTPEQCSAAISSAPRKPLG